ncbi:diguanylate cyclase [Ideonella sp. DXS22W]|uniref:diguanylate cyclase n=1 Tax=Pseudaquabacterium inlustre TaxID=2984192 RepID=A0ABU9CL22_9BURK
MPTPESRRLQTLLNLSLPGGLGDKPREELRQHTEEMARLFNVPVCQISVLDRDAQHVLAAHGPAQQVNDMRHCLCAQMIAQQAPLVVPDLQADPRWHDHPLLQADPPLRFYAGVPVPSLAGVYFGALCIMDHRPRPDITPRELGLLQRLAVLISSSLERRMRHHRRRMDAELLSHGPTAAVVLQLSNGWPPVYTSGNLREVIGLDAADALAAGTPFEQLIHADDRSRFADAMRGHLETPLPALQISYQLAGSGGRCIRQSTFTLPSPRPGEPRRVCAYLVDETRQKRLEASIAATKDRLLLAVESAQLGTFDLDLRTGIGSINARLAEIIGHRLEDYEYTPWGWLERVHPLDRHYLDTMRSQLAALGDGKQSVAYRVRHSDGHYVWVQSYSKVAERDAAGMPQRVVGTLMDVTAQKHDELKRQRQRQLLDALNDVQASFLLNQDMRAASKRLLDPLLAMNESLFGFIGILRKGPDGQRSLVLPAVSDLAWDAATRGRMAMLERQGRDLHFDNFDNLFGHVITHETVVRSAPDAPHPAARGLPPGHPPLSTFLGMPIVFDGQVTGMIGLANRPGGYDDELVALLTPLTTTLGALIRARELDEARRNAEAELQRLAVADGLTGLLNRRAFMAALQDTLERCHRGDGPCTLAMLDLDHFKQVNDRHGHPAGDEVLRHFAEALRGVAREVDIAGRLGGEEFALLLHGVDVTQALVPLERLRASLAAHPVPWDGQQITVTVSIGTAVVPERGASIQTWLAAADRALYAAKQGGRDRIHPAD